MKMEQIECSETSAYKIQTPGNLPEENIQTRCNFWFQTWVIIHLLAYEDGTDGVFWNVGL
jgi:hypothetical protein